MKHRSLTTWSCVFALMLFSSGAVQGSDATAQLKCSALAQAKVLEAAFNARRYDIVLAMAPKRLRETVGSAAEFEKTIATSLGDGVKIGTVSVGAVLSLASFDGESFVTFAKQTQVIIDDGECLVEGGLLGVTADGGKTWEFMDISQNIRQQTEAFSKQLADKLVFPETRMLNGDFVFIRQGDEWKPDAATLKMMRGIMDGARKR